MSYEVTVTGSNTISVDVSQVGQQGVKGVNYIAGGWVVSTAYADSDVLFNNGTSYICILAHTSASTDEPGVGVNTATYWEVFSASGADGADGVDGAGFTGGSYNAGTGVVTFTSDDGLGFVTGDLRGADGSGSGTVTSIDITGGTGITSTGGPITSTGAITVALDAATQTSLGLADSALQSGDIGVSIQGYSAVLDATTASYTTTEASKLAGIEAAADVTDTANVTAAGALMDSEVTNLAAVKAFNPADYATSTQGAKADTALQDTDFASQAEAEAGTDNTSPMTPLRTAQAISALSSAVSDSVAALTPAATVDIDLSSGTIFTLTPDQSTTFTLSNTTAVDSFTLTLTGGGAGFGLSSAAYDSVSFSVTSQDTAPSGIAFNTDGTKMYIMGLTNDIVYQYTLSTGFDLSTASYDSVSFSVGSQDTSPWGIAFNNDGTKMYMVGGANVTVYQYTLSTGFDLSTASYDSVSFSVGSQDTSPFTIAFNNDGTKMYMVGGNLDTVYQYTLSTGFDLSTASYDGVSFSVGSQDTGPVDIAFNTDGTKMYVLGLTNDTVYQYTLSTGFDLSTASYDSVSFSVTSQETVPRSVVFNTDGTKMYIVGSDNDTVYQYSTFTPATFTYPAAFKWPAGTAPDTPAVGETDVITAYTTDSGTTWYAFQAGDAMA
jgi:hypothetical protein